jgi:Ca2+-binding EF-hand superfamily protein
VDFVSKLLVIDPSERLSVEEALDHPWLKPLETKYDRVADDDFVDDLVRFASASALRRACLYVMVYSIPRPTRAKMMPKFLAMDKDHSGLVSLPEFKECLQKEWDMTDNDVERLFDALDMTSSGMLTYTEIQAAMVSRYVREHPETIAAAFRHFANKDGEITKSHLANMLGADEKAERMMQKLDSDLSGAASFEEFREYILGPEEDVDEEEEGGRNSCRTPRALPRSNFSRRSMPTALQAWFQNACACCSTRDRAGDH